MSLERIRDGFRARGAAAVLGAMLAVLGCDAGLEHLASGTGATSAPAGSEVESLDNEGVSRRLYYQFVDGQGRVHFVQRLDAVPAEWRETMGYVELDVAPPLSPLDARRARNSRATRAPARTQSSVVLYSAEWCGACRKAKRHLERRGVRYELRDVDEPQHLEALVATTGRKGIPVLEVDGRVITGFSASRYDELLRL